MKKNILATPNIKSKIRAIIPLRKELTLCVMGKDVIMNRFGDIKIKVPLPQSSAFPHSASPGFQANPDNY